MISQKIKQEVTQFIKGPAGQLQIVLDKAIGTPRKALGFICHPHPLYGGTMQNKVVTTLAKTFQNLGVTTIRFNFRGVGQSDGEYNHGDGETDDLLAVINWAQREIGYNDIWLAGFSFGGYIAARAASLINLKQLVTVAPAVQHFPMAELPPITCPWILVQGERDDVVPAEVVYAWLEGRNPKPHIISFPDAGHFFHGDLGELRRRLEEALHDN